MVSQSVAFYPPPRRLQSFSSPVNPFDCQFLEIALREAIYFVAPNIAAAARTTERSLLSSSRGIELLIEVREYERMKRADLSSHSLSSKFLRTSLAPDAPARLFCFPFAGGSASAFTSWGEQLKPEIEVWAAQPRGRGARFRETPRWSVTEMVEDYLMLLRDHLDLPFAFYGHSLGGLIALELTLRLREDGLALPEHLFIGASAPPVLPLLHPRIHDLPDEPFVSAVRERYAGIPDAVQHEPELMKLFLPALKADYAAYETFDRDRVLQIPCPITALAGSDDPVVRPLMMAEWRQHTGASFELCTVPGDHFFLSTSRDLVLSTIRKKMLRLPKPSTFSQQMGPCQEGNEIRVRNSW